MFYRQQGTLRFISHLDVNRFMIRALRLTGLPIWYTEGFNPRPYVTFALPLSLGFESSYSAFDFRLTDDSITDREVYDRLCRVLPRDMIVTSVGTPVEKVGAIAFAVYDCCYANPVDASAFYAFLQAGFLVVSKKTKRGELKTRDITEQVAFSAKEEGCVELTLPAGQDNINPTLLTGLFAEKSGCTAGPKIIRTAILNAERELFR